MRRSRGAAGLPVLEVFKRRADVALSDRVSWWIWVLHLWPDLGLCRVFSNLQDSMI